MEHTKECVERMYIELAEGQPTGSDPVGKCGCHVRSRGSARFHEILTELGVLHDKKQTDYGRAADPFANVRASEQFGIPGWVGCMVRANDKMVRIQKAAREGKLANESLEDSLRDLAVYAVIGLCLLEEAK